MNILVVDDHPLVRRGIISILAIENDIEQINEASNVEDAVKILYREKPDVAIIDLNLGKEDGLDIIEKYKNINNNTKYLILTSSVKKEDYLRARSFKVDGYILKEAFVEDLIYAVRIVARGKKYIDPDILEYRNNYSKEDIFSELTSREKDVLKELGEGLSNSMIAEKLFISENTVKKHVSNILSKLELTQRTQAALLVNEYSNRKMSFMA